MVYINGRPYCAKNRATPFNNLELPGITPEALATLEATLKSEVLAEASLCGGRILLHSERDVVPAVGESRVLAAWGKISILFFSLRN